MPLSFRHTRVVLVALAACALTWAFAVTAFARPVGVEPVNASAAQPAEQSSSPAVGDHSVPDPRQVDAVLADLKRDDAPAAPASATGDGSDTGTVALVLSIVAILTALGAVSLTITRPRGRVLET
jgi:hypothetical protein